MKRCLALFLVVVICLAVMPLAAFAADASLQENSSIAIDKTAYNAFDPITVTVTGVTEKMVTAQAFIAVYEKGAQHDKSVKLDYVTAGNSTKTLLAPNKNGEFEVRLYSANNSNTDDTLIMAAPFTVSGATGSEWAQSELEKANELGLIPESLKGKDLAQSITRAEFAAVSVKAYEAMSGTKALPAISNPFMDTNDAEVLKAYNAGITAGVTAREFEPDTILNREQAATMLTRVFKKTTMPTWSLATDASHPLSYAKPAVFADDAKISDWAKESVYFMVVNNIIKGVGDNKFAPQNTTPAEEAEGYANATREQAIIIAVRMVENLK